MSNTAKWIIAIIVIILIIAGVWYWGGKPAVAPAETGPIKIGWIGPLTGDGATIGQNAKVAVELAISEINSKGGINGRQLEVVYEDGKCDGKEASNAANKLINIDKVNVILGGACSGETLAFANAANQSKMPVLSYCSSAPGLTNSGDYIFRNVPSDAYQGTFAADYIFSTMNKKKVAVLYQQTEWSSGIREVFVAEYKKKGGEIVFDEAFDKDERDFKTQLTKIKAVKPDLIYFVSYAEPAIPALKQIAELGIKTQLFGADAWSDPKIPQAVGKNAEGLMFTKLASKENQDFIKKMEARTSGAGVTECSAPAYDAVYVLADVFARAGSGAEAIKNALYQTDYKGGVAYDETKFDSNGDLIGAKYSVGQIKDGKAVNLQ